MRKILDWLKDEPVRVYLYSIVVVVVTFLGIRGEIDATSAEFYTGAAATILAVERARAKVTPTRKIDSK